MHNNSEDVWNSDDSGRVYGDFNGSKPHTIQAADPYVGFPAMTIPELEEKLAVDATPFVAFR